MKTAKNALNNVIVLLFPGVFILFMLFASEFILSMRKHIYLHSFNFVYVVFWVSLFFFVRHYIYKATQVAWPCLLAGIIELVLFHCSGFWKAISYAVYSEIWCIYPYNFFLLEIGIVIYGVMLCIKITNNKR